MDAPEKIWIDPIALFWARFPHETDWIYRRADLPPTLEQALAVPEVRALVDAVMALDLRHLVAGWNGEGLSKPHTPHPPHQTVRIPTTTGTVYVIDAALRNLKGKAE